MTSKSSNSSFIAKPEKGSITQGQYKNRKEIESLIIPEKTEILQADAFRNCRNLKEVKLPSTLIDIGSRCFEECSSLCTFTIHPDNPIYSADQNMLLKNCGRLLVCAPGARGHFTVKDSVRIIEDLAFSRCSDLLEIQLPDQLQYIGAGAFARCSQLKEIRIPGSCRDVADHCFEACSSLEHVILSEGIQNLGAHCFDGCSALKTLRLPCSLQRIMEPLLDQDSPTVLQVYDHSFALDYVLSHDLPYQII